MYARRQASAIVRPVNDSERDPRICTATRGEAPTESADAPPGPAPEPGEDSPEPPESQAPVVLLPGWERL